MTKVNYVDNVLHTTDSVRRTLERSVG